MPMLKIVKKRNFKYLIFGIPLLAFIPRILSQYDYYIQLNAELNNPLSSPDLNIENTKLMIDNWSYLEYINSSYINISMYISLLFILLGLFFANTIRDDIKNNNYYMYRNRLPYFNYLMFKYKKIILQIILIETILMLVLYAFCFALGPVNFNIILFIQSLIPFIFIMIYSILVVIITINLGFIVTNRFVLQIIPYLFIVSPILLSSLLNKLIDNHNVLIMFSYQTFIPYFSYTSSDSSINILNYLSGNLSNEQVSFMLQYVNPFVLPYTILIIVTIVSCFLGNRRIDV